MITLNNFKQIFAQQRPLLDLRAPIEFNKGSFSHATNIPLMTDDERAQVGTCYKELGQQAAIELGHQLVCGQTKQQRLDNWLTYCQQHPQGAIYCFRGGLRSHTVQQWLADAGVNYPLIQGGYKALRGYLLEQLDVIAQHPLVLLAGNTGSGKTEILNHIPHSLDLEGAAHHRGSSFGAYATPPATQIHFENTLSEQYLGRQYSATSQTIILEDEGRMIGNVHLPESLEQAMKTANVVVVEQSFEYRLERLLNEYVIDMYSKNCLLHGIEQGKIIFNDYLTQGLFRVRKRLGSERYIELNQAMSKALAIENTDSRAHLNWLKPLLEHYYDPMYQYQLGQKQQRIVFQGSEKDCISYLNQL